MEIKIQGKVFTLRADLAALMSFEQETGLKFGDIGEDSALWEVGSLVYHFAKRGAEESGAKFDYDVKSFLGLVQVHDLATLMGAVGTLLAGPKSSEKKAEAAQA